MFIGAGVWPATSTLRQARTPPGGHYALAEQVYPVDNLVSPAGNFCGLNIEVSSSIPRR